MLHKMFHVEQLPLSFTKFIYDYSVSCEIVNKLIIYYELLIKWQKKINLISPTTLTIAWERHFLDSAQLFTLLPDHNKSIFDLGSGAGFPGLVLSILGIPQITLLESDQRKTIFLSEVIRATDADAKIANARIETIQDNKTDVIISRACASLDKLFFYASGLLKENGECLFLKGKGVEIEIEEAKKRWMFHVKHIPSLIDKEGVVLQVSQLSKKQS
jgi:16S rRNA (guanine527-N7)-methyltransferase